MSKEGMSSDRLLLAGALMLLSIAALSAWRYMPIYPDEVAFQLLFGRYIPDHGFAQRLFYICPSNGRETPFLFAAPAWIYSWLCLNLSLVQMRFFPFAATLAAVFLAIWSAAKGRNPAAAFLVTTALVGVAGSSLVLARVEYWQVLNVFCCLWAFSNLESAALRTPMRCLLAVIILSSCLLSMYSHMQGLIFLPLSLYLVFRLVGPCLGRVPTAVLLTAFFVAAAATASGFHSFSCSCYPGIEKYFSDMVMSVEKLKMVRADWLMQKIINYAQPFYFSQSYQIGYLPGIAVDAVWLKILLAWLNQGIYIILVENLILFVLAGIASLVVAIWGCATAIVPRRTGGISVKDLNGAVPVVLVVFPVMFLFFYDAAQNFYRSIFINLLVSIIVAMFLSRIDLGRLRTAAAAYSVLCGAVAAVSLAVNVWWFTDNLRGGYEGPSVPLTADWNAIDRDVLDLARDCGMDLSKGRIIVDDMTYQSLKMYPDLYPVTYVKLSSSLCKLTAAELFGKVRPNYAVVRCGGLNLLGMNPQIIRNKVCGVNFLTRDSSRLRLNMSLPFTAETRLTRLACVSGWNTPEATGTWTAAPKAELRIPLEEDPGGDVLVAFDIGLLDLPGVKNRLRITAKGRELFSERFEEGVGNRKILFTYPHRLLGSNHTLGMTLESDTHVLGELQPQTRDARRLGVFLIVVRVERGAPSGSLPHDMPAASPAKKSLLSHFGRY